MQGILARMHRIMNFTEHEKQTINIPQQFSQLLSKLYPYYDDVKREELTSLKIQIQKRLETTSLKDLAMPIATIPDKKMRRITSTSLEPVLETLPLVVEGLMGFSQLQVAPVAGERPQYTSTPTLDSMKSFRLPRAQSSRRNIFRTPIPDLYLERKSKENSWYLIGENRLPAVKKSSQPQ